MLQLFNVNWSELAQKMPEIAEAGYTSLWLPPPAKAGSVYSVGYDMFDPFDLGDKDQRGTVRTRYGTKTELQKMVEIAHRFGIRVYFDNIMNHRGFDVPGYNSSTPTNLYPGLVPEDFHLQKNGSTYANWPSIGAGGPGEWGDQWKVQYQPLAGLIDLATESTVNNGNFGTSLGSATTPRPVFVRQPTFPNYYMDTNLPVIAGPWRPFNGTNGDPVVEDVNSYLIRAAMWTLAETRCDGFRFDAVKHVPSGFFGSTSANTDGYTGAIQTMFDYVHGYGSSVSGNGYVESDNNRNSCFDTETSRNDALLFGEHLGEPPSFQEYLDRGMRLLNAPYHFQFNSIFGTGSIAGLQNRDYTPGYGFSGQYSVLFAQSHDDGVANRRELHNAYNFFREGLPSIYSDGYNQSTAPDYFPRVASAPYLGQFGDNKMPEVAYLHHQLSRGGTRARWGDADIIAFERYDYREGGSAADQTVVLFAMNDNYSAQGDAVFLDGEGEIFPAGINKPPGALGDAQGLAVSFPPGTSLVQLAASTPGYERTWKKALVRAATNSRATAAASGGSTVYVGGQTIPAGGGAIEILVPSGGYVAYGIQWPEASRANVSTNAIIFRQGGNEVPRITVTRKDGVNGDTTGFNPLYPFKMRGSVDAYGNVIGGAHVSNLTYAIDIPVVTNANFDILVRCDASSTNALVRLDGGMDLNSQMGLGPTTFNGTAPTNFLDLRDNKPGYVSDVFLGYEQTAFQFRNGPEKFAAKNTLSNTVVSLGAETYYFMVGGSSNIVSGSGYGQGVGQTAAFVYHDPADATTITNFSNTSQRTPLAAGNNQATDLYVKIGYAFYINTVFIYYTTDGSNPEGAFGVGKGSTKVVQMGYVNRDNPVGSIDWWKGTIPGQPTGTQVRYKIGAFNGGSGGSLYSGSSIAPISDSEGTDAKLYGLTQAAITNFNPVTAKVWLHNNLKTNDTQTGLSSGFHIARARVFLPRDGKSSVYNTFAQTFYYAAALPAGTIIYPANASSITSSSYTIVVRADSTVTSAEINIQDDEPANDDAATGKANGNGPTNFVAAAAVAPESGISAQYPNLPQEFRLVYTNVPTSGTAKIIVRLKEFASSVYTNRVTLITNTVNTLAPSFVVAISTPATNGTLLTYATNSVNTIQACYSTALGLVKTDFNVLINGTLLPQSTYIMRGSGSLGPNVCPGYNSLTCFWTNAPVGAHVIQVIYTNAIVPISDARSVVVAPPLRISGLDNNNQLVVWDSAPGVNYVVLATTNLLAPFLPVSDPITGNGTSTYFFDVNPADAKFYKIQMVP